MATKIKPGMIVVTGRGAECFMGTVVAVFGKWATVKYLDFKVPRRVPVRELRRVGI